MKRILSITLKSFIAGIYLYLIAQQINSGNNTGIILGLTVVVVLIVNIYIREEYHAAKRHLKDTQHFARKYWEHMDLYE